MTGVVRRSDPTCRRTRQRPQPVTDAEATRVAEHLQVPFG